MFGNLVLLKTYNISIAEGHSAPTIRLEDEVGGDMFFTIHLTLEDEKNHPGIYFQSEKDEFHAEIKLVVSPNVYSSLNNPIKIGTYKKCKDLLLDILAKPLGGDDKHEVVVSFYIADCNNGTK